MVGLIQAQWQTYKFLFVSYSKKCLFESTDKNNDLKKQYFNRNK